MIFSISHLSQNTDQCLILIKDKRYALRIIGMTVLLSLAILGSLKKFSDCRGYQEKAFQKNNVLTVTV